MALAAVTSDPFHAISEPNRGPYSTSCTTTSGTSARWVAATGLSYSLVSQHLQVLRDAGAVDRRAAGGTASTG